MFTFFLSYNESAFEEIKIAKMQQTYVQKYIDFAVMYAIINL